LKSALQLSNDKLRDHVWSLLRPKHFLKWKERHIINYDFPRATDGSNGYQFDKPQFFYPKPYTTCVQQLKPGVWMVPGPEDTWWCVKPCGGA
jgi:proteinaceous RNase P